MFLFKIFLLPVSIAYGMVTWVRNIFYRIGIFDEKIIPDYSICVGNLTVGGTGKTPMTELLIKKLHPYFEIAMLSRGYGRSSRGFYEADAESTPAKIGDEPLQIYLKFKTLIKVFVGENRWNAILNIRSKYPSTNLILLDDAYQHRGIKAKINILLSDYYRPFYSDWLLPTGLLRESRWGAKRAKAVVVTKCPPMLSAHHKTAISKQIRKYCASGVPIFFSFINYGTPLGSNTSKAFDSKAQVFIFSGIANDEPLVNYAKNNFQYAGKITFNDHHRYTHSDIIYVINQFDKVAGSNKILLTTEKDHVKLQTADIQELLKNYHLYYLPIEISMMNQEKEFELFLLDTLNA